MKKRTKKKVAKKTPKKAAAKKALAHTIDVVSPPATWLKEIGSAHV